MNKVFVLGVGFLMSCSTASAIVAVRGRLERIHSKPLRREPNSSHT